MAKMGLPHHMLFWQYGCGGKHVHARRHDDGTDGRLPHHHHDERCQKPPIVRLLEFMSGAVVYEAGGR